MNKHRLYKDSLPTILALEPLAISEAETEENYADSLHALTDNIDPNLTKDLVIVFSQPLPVRNTNGTIVIT